MTSRPPPLFERVVDLTGLPSILGPGLVRRVLRESGSEPDAATPRDYVDVLDRLEGRLSVYLTPEEARRRRERIRHALSDATAPGVE